MCFISNLFDSYELSIYWKAVLKLNSPEGQTENIPVLLDLSF
jgi:hypothetical protein